MRRHALPALAAVAIALGGPHRERFDVVHLPRLLLLLVLGAAVLAEGRQRRFGLAEWGVAAVVLFAGAGAALASSPTYTLVPLLLLLACFALATGTAWRDGGERDLWLAWLGAAALAVAASGVVESLGLGPASLRGRAPSATMGQRNALAHFLALASPVVWTLALRARTWGPRVAWLLGAALMAAVVVQTRSRAAWLVAPLGFVGFAVLTRSARVAVVGASVAAAAALSAALPPVLQWTSAHPYADTLGRLVDARSGSGLWRLHEWKETLSLFFASPMLGAGPGHWFVEYGVARGADHFAHSDWVGLLSERGALGAAAVLATAAGALIAWRGRSDFALVAVTLGIAAGVGAFDAVTQLPAPAAWVTLVAFVGIRAGAEHVRARLPAGVLAVCALGVASMLASRLLSTAAETPFDRLERAAVLDPFDGELRLTLGEAYVSAGQCEAAAPHLAAARRLLPKHPYLPTLEQACRQRSATNGSAPGG